jgi:tetratricopeptide (TPR) repeat protein
MHLWGNFISRLAGRCGFAGLLCCGMLSFGSAQELDATRTLFLTGNYTECLAACEQAQAKELFREEEWRLLQAQTLFTLGQYQEAELVVCNALARSAGSVRLRLLGMDTANFAGQPKLAQTRLREINELVSARSWAYRDPVDIIALGRVALLLGVDAKSVLERLYQLAQKADPSLRDTWLASGDLALEKNDYALAAKTYSEGLKKAPDDADTLYGLARAYQPSARGKMLELLQTALEKNEHHIPSLLLLVDHSVDAEEYEAAEKLIARALKVNPHHPLAWAYRTVLAHLRNDAAGETAARGKALQHWTTNPEVDYLIGTKLAQKYRFAEGAAYQRRSLAFKPDFLPAQIQLAEDLLRLGEEAEGWKLAETVHQRDGYDVTAYNLHSLHGTMQKFQTLTNADFVLRMSPAEAALYGGRALALLDRAKNRLTEKYGIELAAPTFIEIFPEQKDFAVRTFGMPDNPGFLGVCFGRVVTANSPASQGGSPANWEAVLWHEFCHVVTLQMTKNKMPRWLSEGISVYEELQANPSWGQTMNPRYREMVLGDDLKPVSELSSAFLSPKSDLHVQFAYYQSSLVIEYLVSQFGFEKLKAILRDLGEGVNINDAIPKHTAPMKQIEKEFAAFAKAKARALGPGLEWEKPVAADSRLQALGLSDATLYGAPEKSKNYWVLLNAANKLMAEKQWEAAKAPLQTLIELYPDQSGPNNAYALLAAVHRSLSDPAAERIALEQWAAREADALDAYLRLMELAEIAQDWNAVTQNAERFLAVNPLLPQPYRFLATASEGLGKTEPAISAYQKLLLLDPADPAEVHFRLARQLHLNNHPTAKRHVLQALEEAPRFREAHQLLLELAQADSISTNAPAVSNP